MQAKELYNKMDSNFEIDRFTDSWEHISYGDQLAENFKQRQVGVFLDNTGEIAKVYSAVFPADAVIERILDAREENCLLFLHHPQVWDLRQKGFPFKDFDRSKLERLKKQKISLYALHVPLDNNGEYSASVSFARALGVAKEKDFAPYGGGMAGVIGHTDSTQISELAESVRQAVGHEVKIFNYGSAEIKNQKVAVVAGGGNNPENIKGLPQEGINAYVTGIAAVTAYPLSRAFHEFTKENRINVIAATHYSTEKFACMAMCGYFEKLGLPCEFLEDQPDPMDL